MRSAEPLVSALVVNYNTAQLLKPSIEPLRASLPAQDLQIIVVDNASRDGSVGVLRASFGDCDVIENPTNVGFGRANNQALGLARGRFVLLLNTDAFVAPDTVAKTLAFMQAHPRCGVLGVRLIGRDRELQPSCRYFPTPWNVFLTRTGLSRLFRGVRLIDDMTWDHASARACDWVPGCYYLVRREVIDQVGLFDPRYFLYYEEVDHCRAVKAAGWEVWFCPDTTVVHIGGESAKVDATLSSAGRQIPALQVESELLYFRKHHGLRGVWLSMALTALADAILALKWLLRRRPVGGASVYWRDFASRWSLLRRTAWASRPTR